MIEFSFKAKLVGRFRWGRDFRSANIAAVNVSANVFTIDAAVDIAADVRAIVAGRFAAINVSTDV